ncbi:hypothetical protein ACLKA6_002874 [Drosophila palustris]
MPANSCKSRQHSISAQFVYLIKVYAQTLPSSASASELKFAHHLPLQLLLVQQLQLQLLEAVERAHTLMMRPPFGVRAARFNKTMDEAEAAAGEANRAVDNVVKGGTRPAGRMDWEMGAAYRWKLLGLAVPMFGLKQVY